mgnify:FL=1
MAYQNREFGEDPPIHNPDKYEEDGDMTNDIPVNVDPFLYDYTPRRTPSLGRSKGIGNINF